MTNQLLKETSLSSFNTFALQQDIQQKWLHVIFREFDIIMWRLVEDGSVVGPPKQDLPHHER